MPIISWRFPSLIFSFFHFSCREQGKSVYFRYFFSLVLYPCSQMQNKAFYRFLLSVHPLTSGSSGDLSSRTNPEFFSLSAGGRAYPGPLIKGSLFRSKATTKPRLEKHHFSWEMNWFKSYLPCPSITNAFNDRVESRRSRENHSALSQQAQSRRRILPESQTLPIWDILMPWIAKQLQWSPLERSVIWALKRSALFAAQKPPIAPYHRWRPRKRRSHLASL